jgi:hypothetical protein
LKGIEDGRVNVWGSGIQQSVVVIVTVLWQVNLHLALMFEYPELRVSLTTRGSMCYWSHLYDLDPYAPGAARTRIKPESFPLPLFATSQLGTVRVLVAW